MRKVLLHLSALFKKKKKKKWTRLHGASRASVCAKQGCARRRLFTVSRMSDSTARSPPRKRERPMLHANEHSPTKCTPPTHTPSCPHLAPCCLPLDTSTRKHAGSRPPLHSEGAFYLTGGRNSPRESVETLSEKCRRETKNPITPTVSTVMVGCISRCLH